MDHDERHNSDPHAPEPPAGSTTAPFFREAHKRKIPFNVQVQLTDLCNLRCEHCYNSLEHKRGELTFDELMTLFRQLREAGTMYLCLTGGEPTLHPRFADIARAARGMGFCVEVITNATLLTEDHYALFREIGMHYIAVSLHGMQQASHERLTRSPESFRKTVAAIERMKADGLPVQLRIPVTRYNYPELDDMLTYADVLDLPYRFECNITYREDGDPTSTGMRVVSEQAQRVHEIKWRQRLAASKRPVTGWTQEALEGGKLCSAGHTFCYIDSVGTVHPCPSYNRPAGNVREQTFSDIWWDSEFLQRLRNTSYGEIKGCSGCSDMGFCHFCPGDARLEGEDKTDGFAKYSRACRNAAINREAYKAVAGEIFGELPEPVVK